jgi:flagellar biosynthesis protein FlhB
MSETPDRDQQTEAPTAKRKADAGKKGDILQSREFGTAILMVAGAAWLALLGPQISSACLDIIRMGLSIDHKDIAHFDPHAGLVVLISRAALPLAILFAAAFCAMLLPSVLLSPRHVRFAAILPKSSRLDPVAGLRRIFGLHGAIELGKAVAKTVVLGLIAYHVVTINLDRLIALGNGDIKASGAVLGSMIIKVICWLVFGLSLIAAIDVPTQIVRRAARLRMSRQEIKQEMRESEGAPELKHAVRQRQSEILNNSTRKSIGEATVVLTNPTHFAIALRYDPLKDFAPLVVARGRDATADAIRRLAQNSGVPLLDYPQLTRAIYFTSRAGHPIAPDLYHAVATVLAFVFNLDQAVANGVAQPNVDVPSVKRFDQSGNLQK